MRVELFSVRLWNVAGVCEEKRRDLFVRHVSNVDCAVNAATGLIPIDLSGCDGYLQLWATVTELDR